MWIVENEEWEGKGNGIRSRDRTRGRRGREFGRKTARGRREEGQAKGGVV